MACAISNDDFQSDLRDDSWLKIIGLSSLMFTRVGDGWQVASKSRMNIEGEAQIKIDKSTYVIQYRQINVKLASWQAAF